MRAPDSPADAARFTENYRAVAPALRAWAELQVRGTLAGALEPDDLVQEVCLQAFSAFPRFDPALGGFRGWLFGVAHRVLRGALRSALRARSRGAALAEPLASRAGAVPEEATTISRRVARDEGLRDFVGRARGLDEEDLRLLVWRGLEGLSHAEVAELLGTSADGASKRWQRLRSRIADWPAARSLLELS